MRGALIALLLLCACPDEHATAQRRVEPVLAPPRDLSDAGAREETGVLVCDAFLEDMARCIRKMDKAAQPAARRALEDTRRRWTTGARSADSQGSLAEACKLAVDAARSATAGMGCSF